MHPSGYRIKWQGSKLTSTNVDALLVYTPRNLTAERLDSAESEKIPALFLENTWEGTGPQPKLGGGQDH